MSTSSTPENAEAGSDSAEQPVMPLAPDRPVVDGTTKSADQIRAEMAELLDEDRQRADDPPPEPETHSRIQTAKGEALAKVRAGTDEAVARVAHQVDRARAALPDTVSTVKTTVQRRSDALAGLAIAVIAILLARRWLSQD
jgi:hypothetical protein